VDQDEIGYREYKSSDNYPTPHDPALKKEYEEYLKKRLGK